MTNKSNTIRAMAEAYLNYEDDGSAEVMGRVQAAMRAALRALLQGDVMQEVREALQFYDKGRSAQIRGHAKKALAALDALEKEISQ